MACRCAQRDPQQVTARGFILKTRSRKRPGFFLVLRGSPGSRAYSGVAVTEVGADPVREPSRPADANEAMHSAQASGDTSRPIHARPHS